MTEQQTKEQELKPGYLVIVTKWWKEGDVVPEGWTTIGSLNAERVSKCPDCGQKLPAETSAELHPSKQVLEDALYFLKYVEETPTEEIAVRVQALFAIRDHMQRMQDAIQWVIGDAAYKAPEQIDAEMARRWIDRLKGALAADETISASEVRK